MREYRMDLGRAIGRLSWRRFCVLLGGLSPASLWCLHAAADEGRAPELAGEALDAWISRFPKAGER
jgi:hypothetical protein